MLSIISSSDLTNILEILAFCIGILIFFFLRYTFNEYLNYKEAKPFIREFRKKGSSRYSKLCWVYYNRGFRPHIAKIDIRTNGLYLSMQIMLNPMAIAFDQIVKIEKVSNDQIEIHHRSPYLLKHVTIKLPNNHDFYKILMNTYNEYLEG